MNLVIEVDTGCGGLIIDAIKKMKTIVYKKNCTAKQELNGIVCLVNNDSIPELIYRDQQRAQIGCITGPVGPYPSVILSTEELISDSKVYIERQQKQQERQAQYELEHSIKQQNFEEKIKSAPEMEISDIVFYNTMKYNNTDPYGARIVLYAEHWVRLMQLEMYKGKSLKEVYNDTSYEADCDGITGFMHSAAKSMLHKCWKYGKELESMK